jgi:tetratricopeptide (TPR) repeat protein
LSTRNDGDVALDPLTFGKQHRVDYVLAANYQLIPGRIRLTAQLLNVASGVIENTYQIEKDTADMFAMQDAIADQVSNELVKEFRTTSVRQTQQRGTSNEEAYRLYLHGIYLANNRNLADAQRALTDLEEAVRLDPNYARAWAGLGYVHRTFSNYFALSTHESYQRSMAAISKAMSLDPNLSEAHSSLCENKYLYEWDFAGAEQACRRAIELDPGSGQAHEIFSRYLMGRGRHDEAIAEIKTAIDIDPSSRFYQRNYARALFYARRFAEASAQFERVVSMDRGFPGTHNWLSASLAFEGKMPEAFESFLKLLVQQKPDEETVQTFKTVFATSGWQGVLRERAKRFDSSKAANVDAAMFYAQTGNRDMAFQYLEKMYELREIWITYLQVEPRFDSLRDDPRYVDLLRRMERNQSTH